MPTFPHQEEDDGSGLPRQGSGALSGLPRQGSGALSGISPRGDGGPSPTAKKAKLGKDPSVPTHFLPDADREKAEEELRNKLKKVSAALMGVC